ncbi:MAG: molybdopterin molybdenumtransferase MoeA [Rhodobacterales bacterium]|nr:MAG: molybdopterin molybdenumtransferase MoeA [Rhodobacterales bacterium]
MISVDDALARLRALVPLMDIEEVSLIEATGRVLAQPVAARRDQPPFAASAMDGYAVCAQDAAAGAVLDVIGESAAGSRFDAPCTPGKAVRIFTGAPVPEGAAHVVIQENVTREGDRITITAPGDGANIRPAGGDFRIGDELSAPRLLTPADVALLAAMNIDRVPVRRRPVVALIATGDELVQPGETPGPDQIIASNCYGLHGLLSATGAEPRMLPIAPDELDQLIATFELAQDADLVVSVGGASVGDHDLVGKAAAALGMEQAFYKVAMRPGKPLMAGQIKDVPLIGLPGNPVSAMVCGEVFLRPVIATMLGLEHSFATRRLPLTAPMEANGPRQHFMRAKAGPEGVTPFPSQDSALLTVLSASNVLIVRPPHAPEAAKGDEVDVIDIGH